MHEPYTTTVLSKFIRPKIQRQVYARATLTNSIGNTKIMFYVSVNHQHAHAV